MQPSPQNQQVSLHIPSGTPLFTYMLLVTLLVIALAHFTSPPATDVIQARLGLQGEAVLNGGQFTRLVTALLLAGTPTETGTASLVLGAASLGVLLYTLHTVGVEMEKLWGSPRTILIYVLGGGLGGAASLLLVPLGVLPADLALATATGGTLAMAGAEMVYLYKHRRLYRAMAPQRQAFLSGLVVLNLILSAFVARTDLVGALVALVGGGVLAAFISPFMLPRPHPETPGALLAEDVNPLGQRPLPVMLFTLFVMLLVAVAVTLSPV